MSLTHLQIEEIFNSIFFDEFHTFLVGGYDEPEYVPAESNPAAIRYRLDYGRSALHEISHWCIAGHDRRGLLDYGYWYAPDGRNTLQQAEFFRVESKPQALEWIFSSVSGLDFRPSVDNLALQSSGAEILPPEFLNALRQQAITYVNGGMNPRALRFTAALANVSGRSTPSITEILETPF